MIKHIKEKHDDEKNLKTRIVRRVLNVKCEMCDKQLRIYGFRNHCLRLHQDQYQFTTLQQAEKDGKYCTINGEWIKTYQITAATHETKCLVCNKFSTKPHIATHFTNQHPNMGLFKNFKELKKAKLACEAEDAFNTCLICKSKIKREYTINHLRCVHAITNEVAKNKREAFEKGLIAKP